MGLPDLLAAHCLAPPLSDLIGPGPPQTLPLADLTWQGWSACSVLLCFLCIRFGALELLFKSEEDELLNLVRSGYHIDKVVQISGSFIASLTSTQRKTFGWLQNPRTVLEYAEQHSDFARMYLESEVRLAKDILNDMPAYDHGQDEHRVTWQ